MRKFTILENRGKIYKIDPATGETFEWIEDELNGLSGVWSKIRKKIGKRLEKKIAPLAKTAAAGVITYYGGGALVKTPIGQKLLGPKQEREKKALKAQPIQYDPTIVYGPPTAPPEYRETGFNRTALIGAAIGGIVLVALVLKKK